MSVDDMEFISVSKICNRRKLSVKRVLDFLSTNEVIPKRSQRINRKFTSNNGMVVVSTGDSLRVVEDDLMNYLDENKALKYVSFDDTLNELYDTIEDPKYRFERISNISDGRIAFIDAEFRNGNYHEVAWEIREKGKVVDKKYFIVKEDFLKKFKKLSNSPRINHLNDLKQSFEIISRKHINRIMKYDMRSVDYIVAHNAYGERTMLVNNGIKLEKSRFLCTSKMSLGYIYDRMPSLIELVEHYGISVNSNLIHYAHEDARVAAEVFYKMIETAKDEFNI